LKDFAYESNLAICFSIGWPFRPILGFTHFFAKRCKKVKIFKTGLDQN
jgi:hypothetical protein